MNSSQQIPNSLNLAFVEELYASYRENPNSVSTEWQNYFSQMPNGEISKPKLGPSFRAPTLFNPAPATRAEKRLSTESLDIALLQDKVNQLVRNFRGRGHMVAQLDPLGSPRPIVPDLDPAAVGITEADMDRVVSSEAFQVDGTFTVRELIQHLRNTYCRSIGVEFMHIDDLALRRWLQRRMEASENRSRLTREEQVRILTRLTDATIFEEFIHKKFIGAKSFSLEGCESLIPLLDLALEKAGEHGVKEVVFGMAHRGRLNVLANVIGKSPRQIFREFADSDKRKHAGDVKYHLGHSGDWKTASGKNIHLSLCFNPSHLEFVNPVALGRVRAKQDRVNDREKILCMGLLIHGDAAFAGEGVVQETLNLSELGGYFVGGTLHVVLNNQIGFTTSPNEARSCLYATDVAKMLQIPIFHVNGEDPEAVAQVVQLAMDFRLTFKRDVVIDMWGYRRLGHNEADEPSFTQPQLYRAIEKRKPVREGYLDHLLQLNEITREEADAIVAERREELERDLSESKKEENFNPPTESIQGIWSRSKYVGGPFSDVKEVKTGVDATQLAALLKKQTELPQDFHPHPKIEKFLETRRKMADGNHPLDWSAGEALAFATLAVDGARIRLSGQDCGRGTFTQRHAILHDCEDGHRYIPLQHLSDQQARVEILNSPLSEAGVLGFDYGYSLDYPDGLILWEAQFGDFVNTAQVIIDQFIVSAEDKWRRLSGIVLLLPHGFEGQGPEHSSARLERFLMLSAEDNIQVVYPTTPAQYFHCLRRQIISPWRKPLVIMTPKSLLRHPQAVSTLSELEQGSFQYVIPDTQKTDPKKIKRVLLCTGKIFYDLQKHREELKCDDIALLRLEQLYPLNEAVLKSALADFSEDTPVCWVQEEPANMGSWPFLRVRLGEKLLGRFPFSLISRVESASPATGSANRHKHEQKEILTEAFK